MSTDPPRGFPRQDPSGSHRLAGRLSTARRRLFVGRSAELELFRQALVAEDVPFVVLHLFGPGGVGKTTLLGEYARLAEEHGRTLYRLDSRDIESSPHGFLRAFSRVVGTKTTELTLEDLADLPPAVLLLDTYERIQALDGWIRDTFLPAIPASMLVVIAGRQRPADPWRTDPAWREQARIVSLRNLRPEESRELLSRLGVPERIQTPILDATYGHPLALVLLADWLALNPEASPGDLRQTPDLVRGLAERFLKDAPTPLHRQALEICAHARVTTEGLLAAVLGDEVSHDLFSWLQSLCFIEQGSHGLFPHDLVREVIEADLRWRNPEALRRMHRQIRLYLGHLYQQSQGVEQQRAFLDILFLHRYALMRTRYEFKAASDAYIELAKPEDREAILKMVDRHEGPESASIAAYWLKRHPAGFEVFRTVGRAIIGFVAHLLLERVTPKDERTDPAMGTLWRYIRSRNPLRSGESALITRFWMGEDSYQEPFIHTLVATSAFRRWMNTPNLAWSFPCMANPDYWEEMFAYLNFHRAPEADFSVGGRSFGVFCHDWRLEPQSVWLDVLADRELQEEFRPETKDLTSGSQLLVLSQPEFADAVRQALRDFARPDRLNTNPLMRSRLVRDRYGMQPDAKDLQELIEETAKAMEDHPKDAKLYNALRRTYLSPAPSQEKAAEVLGLPFSTYRYHLKRGIERVTELLWQQELYGLKD